MAAPALAGIRVAADPRIVYPGGDLHDDLRRDLAAARIAHRAGHGSRRRVGVSREGAQVGDEAMLSRREFASVTLGSGLGLLARPAAAKINSKVNGVTIGAQSYSFRDRPLDKAIEGYKEVGLGLC